MLVLKRGVKESLYVHVPGGQSIKITLVRIDSNMASVGILAPKEYEIQREELVREDKRITVARGPGYDLELAEKALAQAQRAIMSLPKSVRNTPEMREKVGKLSGSLLPRLYDGKEKTC